MHQNVPKMKILKKNETPERGMCRAMALLERA